MKRLFEYESALKMRDHFKKKSSVMEDKMLLPRSKTFMAAGQQLEKAHDRLLDIFVQRRLRAEYLPFPVVVPCSPKVKKQKQKKAPPILRKRKKVKMFSNKTVPLATNPMLN